MKDFLKRSSSRGGSMLRKVHFIVLLLLLPLLLAFIPGDEIPSYFGPPWEVFENNYQYFTIENSSDPNNFTYNITFEDTDRWVYNTLYYSIDGGAWKAFTLDPALDDHEYLKLGSASLAFEVPSTAASAYVIAYSCKEFEDAQGEVSFRCGCRSETDCNEPQGYWVVQNMALPSTGAPGGEEDCRYPAVTCPAARPFCNIATGDCDECMVSDTKLCNDLEICVLGSCTPVQCVTNADCIGVEGAGVRRTVCHPSQYRCVACNSNVDCIFAHQNGTDITGFCDALGTHTCEFVSNLETFCKDECMPDDVLGYGGVGKCEGNDLYHCYLGEKGCYEYTFVKTCTASCEMTGSVSYCSESPPSCGRPCGADGQCNPYCGTGYDPFCATVDPDCL